MSNDMILRVVISIFFTCSILSECSSQKIFKRGSTYTYEQTIYYNFSDISHIIESNESAKVEFDNYLSKKKAAKTAFIVGSVFLISGTAMATYYSKNDCLEGHCIPGVMAGGLLGTIGIGFYIGALVNNSKSSPYIYKTLDLFNGISNVSHLEKDLFKLELAATSNGVGLLMTF